jgi:hypothetical protein
VEDWKKAMFSKKSHFELTLGNKYSLRRRLPGSGGLDPRFTRQTVKYLPKLIAWACFS